MHGYNTPVSNSFIFMSWLLCRLTMNKIKMTFKKIKNKENIVSCAHYYCATFKGKTYKYKIK